MIKNATHSQQEFQIAKFIKINQLVSNVSKIIISPIIIVNFNWFPTEFQIVFFTRTLFLVLNVIEDTISLTIDVSKPMQITVQHISIWIGVKLVSLITDFTKTTILVLFTAYIFQLKIVKLPKINSPSTALSVINFIIWTKENVSPINNLFLSAKIILGLILVRDVRTLIFLVRIREFVTIKLILVLSLLIIASIIMRLLIPFAIYAILDSNCIKVIVWLVRNSLIVKDVSNVSELIKIKKFVVFVCLVGLWMIVEIVRKILSFLLLLMRLLLRLLPILTPILPLMKIPRLLMIPIVKHHLVDCQVETSNEY